MTEFDWPSVMEYGAPLDVPVDTPLFRAMTAGLRRHDPAAIVLPYMLSGATDAKFAARLGIKSYGFSPLKLEVDEPFGELIHGHDERVPVRALAFGVSALRSRARFLFRGVARSDQRSCAARQARVLVLN